MKRIITTSLIAFAISATQASYTLNIPLEVKANGSLPDGTIRFINQQETIEEWVAVPPLESGWINVGDPTNCTNWTPETNTVALGEKFTQTATDCEQKQAQTIKEREQEKNTLAYRYVGEEFTKNQIISGTSEKSSEGTSVSWEVFADTHKLPKNWENIDFEYMNLPEIPSEPYPLTSLHHIDMQGNEFTNIEGLNNIKSVAVDIYLNHSPLKDLSGFRSLKNVGGNFYINSNKITSLMGLNNLTTVGGDLSINENPLTNLDGLNSLKSVGGITASYTPLTNVDGLSNLTTASGAITLYFDKINNLNGFKSLTSVGDGLYLNSNKITNIEGLRNLRSVGGILQLNDNLIENVDALINLTTVGGDFLIDNNQIKNIDGLKNISVAGIIAIDSNYSGTKLEASTRFCSLNAPSSFYLAPKSKLCNP